MPFSALAGNERIKLLLTKAVVEKRIGHGLIMAGPRGVGKHLFALSLAQALNCERPAGGDACGGCSPCRKITAGDHSDVRTIVADGAFIKIGQMREMSREAQFRPFEGRWKVIILDDADRLREEAANSILKTLEEPPPATLIVLVTSKPYGLLPTVRSRCQMLTFAPLGESDIRNHLEKLGKNSDAALIARVCGGSIGRALEIDLAVYQKNRSVMMGLLDALLIQRNTLRLLAAAEYLGTKLDRAAFEAHLDVLAMLLSDLLRLKVGEPPESLTNADIADKLAVAADSTTVEEIIKLAEKTEALWQSLVRNVNRRVATEALLVSI
jgi:DNA polymerase-3 subunit delta'